VAESSKKGAKEAKADRSKLIEEATASSSSDGSDSSIDTTSSKNSSKDISSTVVVDASPAPLAQDGLENVLFMAGHGMCRFSPFFAFLWPEFLNLEVFITIWHHIVAINGGFDMK
jgi:hypothetical protein